MAEKQRRDREISRREAEMYRVEAIQMEMASAVRFLGGEAPQRGKSEPCQTRTIRRATDQRRDGCAPSGDRS